MERMPGTLVGWTTTAGGAEGWRRWEDGGDIGKGTGLRASSMEGEDGEFGVGGESGRIKKRGYRPSILADQVSAGLEHFLFSARGTARLGARSCHIRSIGV